MEICASSPSPDHPQASPAATEDPLIILPAGDMWVFAYGSLMWNPGFPHGQARLAKIHGYHRALCVWSWVHRGTRDHPGLVFGLDRGGSCVGIAHRVSAAHRDAAAAYLYERELVTHVYKAVARRIRVDGVGVVAALTFVVDRRHPQYSGKLSPAEAASTIRDAHGRSGPNPDYFADALAHLDTLGIHCPRLGAIQRELDGR
ncbi:MAG: gamma-glutamylcyclotransferase [Gammaproteobacteria bacterium]|jgi:cation transport protein ChaC